MISPQWFLPRREAFLEGEVGGQWKEVEVGNFEQEIMIFPEFLIEGNPLSNKFVYFTRFIIYLCGLFNN